MSKQEYFLELKKEILNQGGAITDLLFISDEMIENAINNGRSPKDLAWAILQWNDWSDDYEIRIRTILCGKSF